MERRKDVFFGDRRIFAIVLIYVSDLCINDLVVLDHLSTVFIGSEFFWRLHQKASYTFLQHLPANAYEQNYGSFASPARSAVSNVAGNFCSTMPGKG